MCWGGGGRRRRDGDARVWVQEAAACAYSAADELAIPSPSDFVRYFADCVAYATGDLVCVFTAPASGLERQYALVAGAVVRDLAKHKVGFVLSITRKGKNG